MKKMSIKTVVAVGIGAALFFVLARFVAIPSGIANTSICLQYAVLALFAILYGPVAGGLIGFIGHTLGDLSWGGSPWWSWVLASAMVGVIIGLVSKKIDLSSGRFGKKELITFVLTTLVAMAISWVVVAPVLDIRDLRRARQKGVRAGSGCGRFQLRDHRCDRRPADAGLHQDHRQERLPEAGAVIFRLFSGLSACALPNGRAASGRPLCFLSFILFIGGTSMEPIISFRDFGFQYRAQAEPTLRHINLDIYPGEKVLIAGASGSGKSTLMSCINGLIPFSYTGTSTGSLTVDGMEPQKESIFALSKSVGTVLQDPDGQFIGLTVGEDIAFSLENDCVPQEEMREIVQKTAELVSVEGHLGYAPHELSGGQKQRVSLAGVMVDEVKILLFDEPLANLDPATGKQTIDLIDRIQKKTQTTVLIVEHRLEDVLYRDVDRIVLMDQGQIVADMHPDELLSSSLLREHGIREPLYLTALRYAGVAITPGKASAASGKHDAFRRRSVRRFGNGTRPFPPPRRRAVARASEGGRPGLWLHRRSENAGKRFFHRHAGRNDRHRRPERRGQEHAEQTDLRL